MPSIQYFNNHLSADQIHQWRALNKTIKSTKLLYRASDNDFCAKKFHQKCDGIANTLTVIWTEFDKKIGGFTPLKWQSPQNQTWVQDNKKQSFIFSVTENDKLSLHSTQYAIQNYKDFGPIFGSGADILVKDKSNTNKSFAYICSSYHNQKYKKGNKATWQRFSGGKDSCYFQIKEWEVWTVELE